MSPTECDPLIKRKRKLGDLPLAELPDPLRDFAVTKNGFLPENGPLKRLPDAYYAPWEDLIERLSALIENNTLRQRVDKLPVLSVEYLKTEAEWQRAFVILGFLTHGYIWGGDAPAQVSSLTPYALSLFRTNSTDPTPSFDSSPPRGLLPPRNAPRRDLRRA